VLASNVASVVFLGLDRGVLLSHAVATVESLVLYRSAASPVVFAPFDEHSEDFREQQSSLFALDAPPTERNRRREALENACTDTSRDSK